MCDSAPGWGRAGPIVPPKLISLCDNNVEDSDRLLEELEVAGARWGRWGQGGVGWGGMG